MTIPAGWPLDPSGAITCLTCHTDIPAAQRGGDPHLRNWNGTGGQAQDFTQFCTNCHSDRNPGGAGGAHWSVVGVAHVTSERDGGHSAGGFVDSASRRCLECHDGVSASEALNADGSMHTFSMGDVGANHPIGVRYPSASRNGSGTRYRPATLLPRTVPLPDGRVSCISCHNLYSTEQYRLTVPIEGSELCFTCHDIR
jgi:predicted CXXCH cytochrome family protein